LISSNRARGGRIVVEQRALRDCQPNRTLDVAGREVVPALELFVETFQHAARLLAGLARAGKCYMIAALLGDDTEPPLDQGQVLPILTKQHRG
jgi:hypothetical protein